MFSRSYQSTMIQSVKKSSLGLIKKMVLYLTPGLLGQVCDEDPGLVGDIVEVLRWELCGRWAMVGRGHRWSG